MLTLMTNRRKARELSSHCRKVFVRLLVCCTGGEVGDILNPAMDSPETKDNLASVRRAELDSAAAIIGYDEVVMLGYRDSGSPIASRIVIRTLSPTPT